MQLGGGEKTTKTLLGNLPAQQQYVHMPSHNPLFAKKKKGFPESRTISNFTAQINADELYEDCCDSRTR
jgi:hypothetical protein